MKRVMTVALLLGVTACHHSGGSSPKLTGDEARAQAVVQACAAKANFLTAGGRKDFYACVAPPGQAAEFQTCATAALSKDGVLTHSARTRFEADLATCIIPKSPSTAPSPHGRKK